MIRLFPYCWMCGETFSPRTVERRTGIVFDAKDEPGEIARSRPVFATNRIHMVVPPSILYMIGLPVTRFPWNPLVPAENIPIFREAGAET